MKRLIPVVVFMFLFTSMSYSQDDKEYSKAIKKMFEVLGTENSFKTIIKESVGVYKAKYPKDSSWNAVEAELNNTSMDALAEMMAPVYKKYLSLADIEAIILFYQTPAGQKYITSLPSITRESAKTGQQWGIEIEKKINKKLAEKLNKK
jgi:uncharacterized protein